MMLFAGACAAHWRHAIQRRSRRPEGGGHSPVFDIGPPLSRPTTQLQGQSTASWRRASVHCGTPSSGHPIDDIRTGSAQRAVLQIPFALREQGLSKIGQCLQSDSIRQHASAAAELESEHDHGRMVSWESSRDQLVLHMSHPGHLTYQRLPRTPPKICLLKS